MVLELLWHFTALAVSFWIQLKYFLAGNILIYNKKQVKVHLKLFFCFIKKRLPQINLPFMRDWRPNIAKIFVFLGSISLVIVWFVFRHKSWVWIIQNLMALSLAINALSYYRLSSYKTVTIILSLFFVYDIFMVFITPTFTNGASIMVCKSLFISLKIYHIEVIWKTVKTTF